MRLFLNRQNKVVKLTRVSHLFERTIIGTDIDTKCNSILSVKRELTDEMVEAIKSGLTPAPEVRNKLFQLELMDAHGKFTQEAEQVKEQLKKIG